VRLLPEFDRRIPGKAATKKAADIPEDTEGDKSEIYIRSGQLWL